MAGKQYGKRSSKAGLRTGARAVSLTYGRTAVFMSARKCQSGQPVLVEGLPEKLGGELLDLDPEVTNFLPQAVTVDLIAGVLLYTPAERKAALAKYQDLPSPRIYTVDFGVDLVGPRKRAVEVKADDFVGDDNYKLRLKQAEPILARYGWEFRLVVVPADARAPIWVNVPLLKQAALRRDLWPTEAMLLQINRLAAAGASTARDFLGPLGLSINHLPHMVVAGALRVDLLTHSMQGGTPVAVAHGDLTHLQLLQRMLA